MKSAVSLAALSALKAKQPYDRTIDLYNKLCASIRNLRTTLVRQGNSWSDVFLVKLCDVRHGESSVTISESQEKEYICVLFI